MAIGLWRLWASRWILVLGLSLGGLLIATSRPAVAQKEEKEVVLPPMVVINVAGAERLLGDVSYMFKTIGREDLFEVVNGFLGNVAVHGSWLGDGILRVWYNRALWMTRTL